MALYKEINLELLKELFCEKNITLHEIGKILGVHRTKVAKEIKNNNLIRYYENPEWLIQKHQVEKNTITKMAKLANCSRTSIEKNMKLHNIQTLDEVRYSGVTKYRLDRNFFDKIDSSEKAYWLGFIIADGCIVYESCETYRLDITLSKKDEKHLEVFKKSLQSNSPISFHTTYLDKTEKSYPGCRLRINNSYLCKSLMKLGVEQRKSGKEKMPIIDEIYLKDLIRGVFDGDGSFSYWTYSRTKKLNCQMTIVGSEELLSNISKIIENKHGITTNVRPQNKIFVITINNNNAIKVMNWLYDNSKIYLKRKKDTFIEYTNKKN